DCGRPSDRPGSSICSRCYETLPWYDEFAKSAFGYLEPVSQLVNIYKFNGAVYLTEDFADALELSFRKKHDASAVDAVVPVPLHPRRLAERGYNQSGLLASAFAERINRICDETSLVRIRDTEHQSRSSGDDRRKNLKGAFRTADPSRIRGRTIVLIDDVMTTGATLDECSEALYAGGAYKVIPFVLAKALMDEDLGEDFIGNR
ncbi:MAG: ComF family protein, partial [Kiritimatiellae bacterium]|nr:ComF family protein [Kiritimatiellia bacterium]